MRLIAFAVLFVALTVVGMGFAIEQSGIRAEDLSRLTELPLSSIGWVVALVLAMHIADGLRYKTFGHVLGVHIPVRAAIEAVIGNVFFSWITPGAALGIPAAIFMLGRRGVPWDAAGLIAYAKSMTGVALLITFAFLAFAFGLGPADLDPRIAAFVLWGTGVTGATLIVLVLGAIWPQASDRSARALADWLTARWLSGARGRRIVERLRDALCGAIGRLGQFRQRGVQSYLLLLACHVPYFACFIGVTATLVLALGGEHLRDAWGASTVYLMVLYLSPTPGASGISEAAAVTFFGHLVPPATALVVVIATRAVTLYLQLIVGFVYLVSVGSLSQILARPDVNRD